MKLHWLSLFSFASVVVLLIVELTVIRSQNKTLASQLELEQKQTAFIQVQRDTIERLQRDVDMWHTASDTCEAQHRYDNGTQEGEPL